MKHKIIYDPVFRSETLFYICKTGNEAIIHAKKKYNVSINTDEFRRFKGTCLVIDCKQTGIAGWMIWVSHKKDWKTMVHEAAHLVFRILDERGVVYSSDNDETWCYLHEFFVSEFWHIMCKK